MKYIVIGAGGIGGWLIRGLAPTIEYTKSIKPVDKNLVIVDGDNFEPSNMARQDFDIYGPKPEIRAAELSDRYSLVNFVPVNKWVMETVPEGGDNDDKIAASELIGEGDVIICAVDNFATRTVVTAAAAQLDNVDLFHAGNDDAYYGSYYHYQRRDGKDITRNPLWKDEFANPTDRNPGELSCEERAKIEGGTQLIWTNMSVAAVVGVKINREIIQQVKEPNTDEAFFYFEKAIGAGRDRSVQNEEVKQDEKVPSGTVS